MNREERIKVLEIMLRIRKEQKDIVECAGGFCKNCNEDIQALQETIEDLKKLDEIEKECNKEIRLQKENEELKRQENIRNIEKYNEIEINELIRTTFRNNFINKDRIKTLSNALYNEYNCRILKGESADDTEMLLLRGEYLGAEKILDINY